MGYRVILDMRDSGKNTVRLNTVRLSLSRCLSDLKRSKRLLPVADAGYPASCRCSKTVRQPLIRGSTPIQALRHLAC